MSPPDSRADVTASPKPAVGHLVTPYLSATESWIHAQLVYNRSFRPIVLTQGTANAGMFPIDPVYDLSRSARGVGRPRFLLQKYLLGSYPKGPYLEILARESVRILHAHHGWEGARTAGLAAATRRPLVVSFYGRDASLLPRSPYWRILYKRLFRVADRILVEGPHMAGVLAAIGAPPERIRVVHLGIPMEEFPYSERRPPDAQAPARAGDSAGGEAVIGLLAASLREKKGIQYALEALAQVAPRHPRLRLRILGDGPLRATLERRAAQPDLSGRVEWLGHRPYPAYREELRRAHFFLAPSVTARDGDTEGGAPVSLLEAQASGLPIVATRHCDIPEVTPPETRALLVPERDSTALAARMEELLQHPERWVEMGRAGRAHVESGFDIRKQVEQISEVYRELL